MNVNPDDLRYWQELAEGEGARQIVRLIDVATHLGISPTGVIKLALELKRETDGQHGRPVLWVNGTPHFSMIDVAAMEAMLKQRAEAAALGEVTRRN